MPCAYCDSVSHTVADCDSPTSLVLCRTVLPKLKDNLFDFWEQYKILTRLSVPELQIIMKTLDAPVNFVKSSLIICIIELNFYYELDKNMVTEKMALTAIVNRVWLLIKKTLPDTTEEESEICDGLLAIDVRNLIMDTTQEIMPIVEHELHKYLRLNAIKSSNDVELCMKHFTRSLFYSENMHNHRIRSVNNQDVYVDMDDTADLLFEKKQPIVIH